MNEPFDGNYVSLYLRLITEESKLFVSVMAGITLKTLSRSLAQCAKEPRVIRAHPNTPVNVGCGCAVFSSADCESQIWFCENLN